MVNFVGAGPGAEDLITVRGARLLKEADVIIYAGSLVSEKLLDYAKEDCAIYNSAKLNLDEVIEIINIANKNGKNVVRLHTGDPSIYGAIREQMDRLDELGINYEIVPGVSSFCGAAAALKAEYTLPDVSQSVIITRMEGRTKVPKRESIAEFAKHKATMVIFLSASMTDLVAKELIAGGYEEDTPAAIVYKATWAEEKVIRCTVGTLNKCAKENNITNHALICVGCFLGNEYELSKLYDSGFSTGLRAAKSEETLKVALISFSEKGQSMAKRISEMLKADNNVEITDIYRCEEGELGNWTAKHFRCDDALLFVGACGIATRAIAPYVTHKTVDPAVIVVDELGKNVIPLLSGHIGGANKLSEIIADKLAVTPSITTATDINGVWAVDTWAYENGMTIKNPQYIKVVSGKALKGEVIRMDCSDMPDRVKCAGLPDGVKICDTNKVSGDNEEAEVIVTYKNKNVNKLTLVPKVLCVGIGCKKGTSANDIKVLWDETCTKYDLIPEAVKVIGSIDLKSDEPGLNEFASLLGVKLITYTASELNSLQGEYATSDFVKSVAGVDSVCERSAVMAAGGMDDSCLIVGKTAKDGVTIAIALKNTL